MKIFKSEKIFNVTYSLIPNIVRNITESFTTDGYQVQSLELKDNEYDIFITKGGIFKTVIGMRTALKVHIFPQMGGIKIEAGVGIFGKQVIPMVIAMSFFWPLLITQIAGIILQTGLDNRVMAIAETTIAREQQRVLKVDIANCSENVCEANSSKSIVKIFVSYCHQNEDWVDEKGCYKLIPWLRSQLKGNAYFWTDHILNKHIGEKYRKHIYDNIQDSDIALLLISQEFSSSDFIYKEELPWIKERFDRNELKIIPLLISQLSRGGRERISWIFELQTIPNDIKPLLEYTASEIEYQKIKIAILNSLEEKIESIS